MNWHIQVAKMTGDKPIPPDMGLEHEKEAGINLSALVVNKPNDMA